MTIFGKTENFLPRFAISEILWSNFAISEIYAIGVFSSTQFSKNRILHKNLTSSSTLVHIIPSNHLKNISITFAWQALTSIDSIHGTLETNILFIITLHHFNFLLHTSCIYICDFLLNTGTSILLILTHSGLLTH
jgi:hypothetical protein